MQDFRIATFLSVCETLNYTHTAQLLHITQPAVSQHIRYLERDYGVQLLVYENKRLALTKQGEMLRVGALSERNDEEMLRRKMRAASGEREQLNLGLTMTVGEFMMPQRLARFLKEKDRLQVQVRIGDTQDLLSAVDAGSVDCAIIEGFFDKTAYGHLTVAHEPFVGVCAPGTMERGRPVAFEDLLGKHLITREAGSGTRAVLEHALAAHNLSVGDFGRLSEVNNVSLSGRLVQEGCGIAFLYRAAVSEALACGCLDEIKLAGAPLGHDISAVWGRQSRFEAFYRRLIADLTGCGISEGEDIP